MTSTIDVSVLCALYFSWIKCLSESEIGVPDDLQEEAKKRILAELEAQVKATELSLANLHALIATISTHSLKV